MKPQTYDAIIVGGGHNGLVAGFSLARAGLSTLVLERRPFVGGACNTEEFAPGFRASTGAYVLSMLREAIWRDMRLGRARHRRRPGRARRSTSSRTARTTTSATTWPRTSRRRGGSPPPMRTRCRDSRSTWPLSSKGSSRRSTGPRRIPGMRSRRRSARARPVGPRRAQATQASGRPCVPVLHERDAAAVGAVRERAREGRARLARDQRQRGRPLDAGNRVRAAARSRERRGRGRRSPVGVRPRRDGPAHRDHGRCGTRGGLRDPLRCRGGTRGHAGEAAPSACASPVGKSSRARRVLSNADPKRTFLSLCDEADLPAEFVARIEAYRCMGTSIKINLGALASSRT